MGDNKILGFDPEQLTVFKDDGNNEPWVNGPYIVLYEDSDDNKIWCTIDGSYMDFIKGGDSGFEIYIDNYNTLVEEYDYLSHKCKLSDEQADLLLQYLRKNLEYNTHKYIETECNISLFQLVNFLKDVDTPLGDLCNDIINDREFPFNDVNEAWKYLNEKRIGRDYLDEPIRRLKTIYSTIERS